MKGEYQFIDLGSTGNLSLPVVGAPGTITSNSIDEKFNTVRVGLNYRFGDEYAPLK